MNLENFIALRNGALYRVVALYGVVFTSLVAQTGIILAFAAAAPVAGKILLATVSISIALFGCLSIPSVIGELSAMRHDKAPGLEGTAYERRVDTIPLDLFSALTMLAMIVTAVVSLWTIFS